MGCIVPGRIPCTSCPRKRASRPTRVVSQSGVLSEPVTWLSGCAGSAGVAADDSAVRGWSQPGVRTMAIWCNASFATSCPTSSGLRKSLSLRRGEERPIAARSWIRSPIRSLADRSNNAQDSSLVVDALDMTVKNRSTDTAELCTPAISSETSLSTPSSNQLACPPTPP